MKLTGYLAWDDAKTGKRPGVLVVHEIWGLNDYAKQRAEKLAALGYVAFACDMFGDGKTSTHPDDAMKMGAEVRKNVETWRGRANTALKVLRDHELVDSTKSGRHWLLLRRGDDHAARLHGRRFEGDR